MAIFDDGQRLGRGMLVKPPSITIERSMPTYAPHFGGSSREPTAVPRAAPGGRERWHYERLAAPEAFDVG